MYKLDSLLAIAPILLAGLVQGCGDGGDDGGDDGLTAWAGSTVHFKVEGELNGETLSFDIAEAEASDTAEFWCEREYEVPEVGGVPDYANGRQIEFKVNGFVEVGGERRRFELEHKMHDTQSDTAGTMVTIVPRSETQDPAADEMWFEWEWHEDHVDDTKTYEAAAQEGSFELGEFTGVPDADGLLIPDETGTIGGFTLAKWSDTEEVAVSFTLNCTTNKVELYQ